jgi:hypothetical protein
MGHVHDKGRTCERTDEVLENYRRRALAAEMELARVRKAAPSESSGSCEYVGLHDGSIGPGGEDA